MYWSADFINRKQWWAQVNCFSENDGDDAVGDAIIMLFVNNKNL